MNKKGLVGILLLIIVIAILMITYPISYAFTSGEETITVKDKWVKYHGSDAKYLVSSEDGQVFEITDSIIRWRFDSSNLYADIDIGNSYSIKTQGWRFAFMSDYKNIIKAEAVR
jgi:uncharacterized protein (UPF0333 family)